MCCLSEEYVRCCQFSDLVVLKLKSGSQLCFVYFLVRLEGFAMDSHDGDANGNGNGVTNGSGNGSTEALPPPPPLPPNVVPIQAALVKKKPTRNPMARKGQGVKGNKISLLTNHFKVNVTHTDGHFFHYSVSIFFYT